MSLCACGDVGIYTCPRCSLPYCCLSCYRVPAHTHCSEIFYKEQVEAELMQRSASKEEKDKMLEVLQRQRYESDQQDPTSDAPSDIGSEDLSELITSVSLKSEEELWDMLSDSEKQAFLKSIKTGSISTLLKPRAFWWNTPTFVYKQTKTPTFSEIYSKEPSEYLKYLVVQAVLAHVHVEMVYCDRTDMLAEYWSVFHQLWDPEDPNVFNAMDAVCVSYTTRANTAGVGQHIYIAEVFDNALKILKLRNLAVEKVCCDITKILTKVNKTFPLPRYQQLKKKLQFYSSWCISEYGDRLLPGVAVQLEVHVASMWARQRNFSHLTGGSLSTDSTNKLIEEVGTGT